jgi:hypothetical protein
VDSQTLLDMTSFIIDHTYVQHNNNMYRQRMGIAMGMNNSPQMAHLYCAIYETEFMLRAASVYYAKPKDKRSNFDKARMACVFNTMRYIDDINSPSSPKGCNFKEGLTDNRQSGSTDGVYPTHVIDDNGCTVANPMDVKLEGHGLICTYLDFTIKIQHDGNFLTTVYQKRDDVPVFRDDMPVFKRYRRFPHLYSHISKIAKHAVMASQLHRFATLCNTEQEFRANVTRLLAEMLRHGYDYSMLRRHIQHFEIAYTARQWLTYSRIVSKHRQVWQQLLLTCDRLARHITITPYS